MCTAGEQRPQQDVSATVQRNYWRNYWAVQTVQYAMHLVADRLPTSATGALNFPPLLLVLLPLQVMDYTNELQVLYKSVKREVRTYRYNKLLRAGCPSAAGWLIA